MELICPVCGKTLKKEEKTLRCENHHCFDIARQGYVNLLPVQQKRSLNPGDTAQQVESRRAFLDGGFYAPIVEQLCELAVQCGASGPVLDVGCGEGYYGTRLAGALGAELTGLDISKEAVRRAAARYKDALWICGSGAHLPVAYHSVGLLTSLFALTMPEEFRRVLRPDGLFFQVLAGEDHLLELKKIIYPRLLHKQKQTCPQVPGFELAESVKTEFSFRVEGEQVQNLLSMTPHVYRISREGARRLEETPVLRDRASCIINVYRPLK